MEVKLPVLKGSEKYGFDLICLRIPLLLAWSCEGVDQISGVKKGAKDG
jgi:hypothetical protein